MTEVMSEALRFMRLCLPECIIFIVLLLIATRINLKKNIRALQIKMPVIGLCYGVGVTLFMILGSGLVSSMADLFVSSYSWLQGLDDNTLQLLAYFVLNAAALLLFMLIKGILIRRMRKRGEKGKRFPERMQSLFYEMSAKDGRFYLRKDLVQTKTLIKAVNYTLIVVVPVLAMISCVMVRLEILQYPLYPLIILIFIGELAYILDGMTETESDDLEGEADSCYHHVNYALMKNVLAGLFPDKLNAGDTSVSSELLYYRTNSEVLNELEDDESPMIRTYGSFLAFKQSRGLELDHKYVRAGRDLLEGRSILFNNPFYYDMIPYLFYPMNRQLLDHRKILVVLGRLGIENEIEDWCREGLVSVNNTPTLWNVGIITDEAQDLDVGILTRSKVHELELYEANAAFLSEVGMMILIEPSHLMTTAQIGLNFLVRYCSRGKKKPVFCSIDKNCDGLLDALSHVLMDSLTEVSATDHHSGRSTYMCWEGDGEHLQHRMLPNLSRYLGFGTELSLAALKNQIEETWWYGGEAFPVVDVRWIAGQYYYDLLEYAALPASQETLDAKFHVTPEMWGAKKKDYQYMTVEDESCNLFEIRRDFSTRAGKEGFVNVISPEYLMKDYMTANEGIFRSDPKAIPYIVADYAHTSRNVVLRLCLRMAVNSVWESELEQELLLINAPVEDKAAGLWSEICRTFARAPEGDGVLTVSDGGRTYRFTRDVIRIRRSYNYRIGKIESSYYISNSDFIRLYVNVLKNIEFVAEDETVKGRCLGTEILGQIYQKHLPGQFFTIAGKYYELVYVNEDGKVILRRAADHIVGRESYRQVRQYRLDNIRVSEKMGDVRERDGMQLSVCYADITVDTPAYWKMDKYNRFDTASRISVNGIPRREYFNKKVLRLGFEGRKLAVTREICRTLTVLINELFVSLFAENKDFLAAVMPGETDIPLTFSVSGCPEEENCIYIIEDSQMDIGLTEAVERNLNRIFSILCDYLEWDITAQMQEESPQPAAKSEETPAKAELPPPSRKRANSGRRSRALGQRPKDEGPEDTESADEAVEAEPASDEDDGGDREALLSISPEMPQKKPYRERAYLLYGGEETPEGIRLKETLDFLKDRGYGNSELKQAREGRELSALIEAWSPQAQGGHRRCDFCGTVLTGAEYETLKDGRDRCMNCSRTAIKTGKEFEELFHTVHDSMETLYGIRLDAPVAVKMVNSQKLHRALGKTFVPTGDFDGRVLGVAISSKKGYSLLVENGSPRISTVMTMAHELTHIWQYENWDRKRIVKLYGKNNELLVYEGMAKWAEIQYAYLTGEPISAKREEIMTRMRDDEYGKGFLIYVSQYMLSEGGTPGGDTPFMHNPPLS